MLHLLPGNQLELLAETLGHLLSVPAGNPLQADVIMVQHQGMQHWLNMQLAGHQNRQVSMNLEFPLPVRQMWTLIRTILGEDRIPQRSPYSREVLVWRIDAILCEHDVQNDPQFSAPTGYWKEQSTSQQAVRRYQLSEQLADLFEQYQMFRPDWIASWDKGETSDWQGSLWRKLVAQNANHPVRLLREAIARVDDPEEVLPSRLFVFGINALAPLWMDFLKIIGEQAETDIHVLYLNPCDDYWGETSSEKQNARARAQWVREPDDVPELMETGNPLIGSLGQQGQAFVKLLSERAHAETSVFVPPSEDSMLHCLQGDLLKLRDGRDKTQAVDDCPADDSILVTSAHSALREVQGLHDWLLHQFNDDPELKPRDILVMCPNVEDYAPFVEAVFSRPGEELDPKVPPLPCSIADRNLKNADATVAAFLELLSLPDARFQVNQVLSWLRVPAIQLQFELSPEHVEQLSQWLSVAAVHWGLDDQHKSHWLETPANNAFTWQQGLDRLLLGYAWGDEEVVVDERLLLPHVEGANAQLLGRMIQLVEELKALSVELQTPRNAIAWQGFLTRRLKDTLFSRDSSLLAAHEEIQSSIDNLAEFCLQSGYDGEIELGVVRHFLQNQLGDPERSGNQFLNGQITVCSMMPMRSIPFRILAVLGLNDGEFPRIRQPYGFDLMAKDKPRLGDRSRRGDDRYLFLEALLSAREKLYLSYQGKDIRNNSERQPSLVLTELMDYLHKSYDWKNESSNENAYPIRELPLQPFSERNYLGNYPGFDGDWLKLTQAAIQPERLTVLEMPDPMPTEIALTELIGFFDHPSRYFARKRLGLFLDDNDSAQLEDSEPFATNFLHRYQVQHELVAAGVSNNPAAVETIKELAEHSGRLPDNAIAKDDLESWDAQAANFVTALGEVGAGSLEFKDVSVRLDNLEIRARLPMTGEKSQLLYRLADVKGKDIVSLWLHHLVANIEQGGVETSGLFRIKKKDEVDHLTFKPHDQPLEELRKWFDVWKAGLCQALPYNAAIGKIQFENPEKYKEGHFYTLWHGSSFTLSQALADDPYMSWFWPGIPEHDELLEALRPLYEPIFSHMSREENKNA